MSFSLAFGLNPFLTFDLIGKWARDGSDYAVALLDMTCREMNGVPSGFQATGTVVLLDSPAIGIQSQDRRRGHESLPVGPCYLPNFSDAIAATSAEVAAENGRAQSMENRCQQEERQPKEAGYDAQCGMALRIELSFANKNLRPAFRAVAGTF